MKAIRLLTIGLLLMSCEHLLATHNRAGEITYVQKDDRTIEATIVTYTRTSSFSADRDSLFLYWGDGDSTSVFRLNGNGEELPNDIKKNIYVAEHEYSTRGSYIISVTDPNRIAGILNIDFPNSVNIPFYLETRLTLLESRFQGANNSVQLLQPPIDQACLFQPYTFTPNAYDIDGDSLGYEFIAPLSAMGMDVPNYILPDEVSPGEENVLQLNEITGELTWDSPQIQGEYNITYLISEYREGFLISSLVRDMQILVRACTDDNMAPEIEVIEELCLVVGDTLTLDFIATDMDADTLDVTVTGGLIEKYPEQFEVITSRIGLDVVGQFRWIPTCEDVAKEVYQIVIRATDAPSRPMTALASLRTVRIRVIAPAPTLREVEVEDGIVHLTWDRPYACDEADNFLGFSVWRSTGIQSVDVDSCGARLGSPYERIFLNVNDINQDGVYSIMDPTIEANQFYCYIIVGEAGSITTSDNIYNSVSSLPSTKLCVETFDLPIFITEASVAETDVVDGSVDISWTLPTHDDILAGAWTLPMANVLQYLGEGAPAEIYDVSISEFADTIQDVEHLHTPINTSELQHNYAVRLENEANGVTAPRASTVFLRATPGDQRVVLSWESDVPWENYNYFIYDVSTGQRILIDSSSASSFSIENLENDQEYCYLVTSLGSYFINHLDFDIYNDSNESCTTPIDNEPPCLDRELVVQTVCDIDQSTDTDEYQNTLTFQSNAPTCTKVESESINIYWGSNGDDLVFLDQIDIDDATYLHTLTDNIAGCYAISVIDAVGNESELSDLYCVDNCPSYILPNTFTPNGDGANDLYVPIANRFIDQVNFTVFNRWGGKVFTTEDADIQWDGRTNDGKEVSEGTYYYRCFVYEFGSDIAKELSGALQLIR